jgi:hypothetical protein
MRAGVCAAFFSEALRAAAGRDAEVTPPFVPPFLTGALLMALPRPELSVLPPPVILLTVAQARRSALCSVIRARGRSLDMLSLTLLLIGVLWFVGMNGSSLSYAAFILR